MRRWILFAVCSTFLLVSGLPLVPHDALAQDRPALPAFAGSKGSPLVTGWGDVETWSQITVTRQSSTE